MLFSKPTWSILSCTVSLSTPLFLSHTRVRTNTQTQTRTHTRLFPSTVYCSSLDDGDNDVWIYEHVHAEPGPVTNPHHYRLWHRVTDLTDTMMIVDVISPERKILLADEVAHCMSRCDMTHNRSHVIFLVNTMCDVQGTTTCLRSLPLKLHCTECALYDWPVSSDGSDTYGLPWAWPFSWSLGIQSSYLPRCVYANHRTCPGVYMRVRVSPMPFLLFPSPQQRYSKNLQYTFMYVPVYARVWIRGNIYVVEFNVRTQMRKPSSYTMYDMYMCTH